MSESPIPNSIELINTRKGHSARPVVGEVDEIGLNAYLIADYIPPESQRRHADFYQSGEFTDTVKEAGLGPWLGVVEKTELPIDIDYAKSLVQLPQPRALVHRTGDSHHHGAINDLGGLPMFVGDTSDIPYHRIRGSVAGTHRTEDGAISEQGGLTNFIAEGTSEKANVTGRRASVTGAPNLNKYANDVIHHSGSLNLGAATNDIEFEAGIIFAPSTGKGKRTISHLDNTHTTIAVPTIDDEILLDADAVPFLPENESVSEYIGIPLKEVVPLPIRRPTDPAPSSIVPTTDVAGGLIRLMTTPLNPPSSARTVSSEDVDVYSVEKNGHFDHIGFDGGLGGYSSTARALQGNDGYLPPLPGRSHPRKTQPPPPGMISSAGGIGALLDTPEELLEGYIPAIVPGRSPKKLNLEAAQVGALGQYGGLFNFFRSDPRAELPSDEYMPALAAGLGPVKKPDTTYNPVGELEKSGLSDFLMTGRSVSQTNKAHVRSPTQEDWPTHSIAEESSDELGNARDLSAELNSARDSSVLTTSRKRSDEDLAISHERTIQLKSGRVMSSAEHKNQKIKNWYSETNPKDRLTTTGIDPLDDIMAVPEDLTFSPRATSLLGIGRERAARQRRNSLIAKDDAHRVIGIPLQERTAEDLAAETLLETAATGRGVDFHAEKNRAAANGLHFDQTFGVTLPFHADEASSATALESEQLNEDGEVREGADSFHLHAPPLPKLQIDSPNSATPSKSKQKQPVVDAPAPDVVRSLSDELMASLSVTNVPVLASPVLGSRTISLTSPSAASPSGNSNFNSPSSTSSSKLDLRRLARVRKAIRDVLPRKPDAAHIKLMQHFRREDGDSDGALTDAELARGLAGLGLHLPSSDVAFVARCVRAQALVQTGDAEGVLSSGAGNLAPGVIDVGILGGWVLRQTGGRKAALASLSELEQELEVEKHDEKGLKWNSSSQKFQEFRNQWEAKHGPAAAKEMALDAAEPAEGPTWTRADPHPFKVLHLAKPPPAFLKDE